MVIKLIKRFWFWIIWALIVLVLITSATLIFLQINTQIARLLLGGSLGLLALLGTFGYAWQERKAKATLPQLDEKEHELENATEQMGKLDFELGAMNIQTSMMREIIRQYLPRTVWEKAETQSYEGLPEIPNESMVASFLFLDIQGFTRYCDDKDPESVVTMLNDIFDPIITSVYDNEGDIDKFIGDSVFAIFPETTSAARAALAIRDQHVSREKPLALRMGIHTGTVIRGNVGNTQRKDNTLVGQNINIASRLEGFCKPNEVLISEAAADALPEGFELSHPYRIKAKGVGGDLRAYFLLSVPSQA